MARITPSFTTPLTALLIASPFIASPFIASPFIASLLGAWLLLLSPVAHAAGEVMIDQPTSISGNGCNPSTARATLSPNGGAISLLFDAFVAEAGGSKPPTDRKTCILDIPVRVAPGYQAAVSAVDYRGFVNLPARGYAQFGTLFNLSGYSPVRIDRRMAAQSTRMDSTYNFHTQLKSTDVDTRWSGCGANTSLRINTSLIVVANAQSETALGGVDSADFSSGIDLQILVRPCR